MWQHPSLPAPASPWGTSAAGLWHGETGTASPAPQHHGLGWTQCKGSDSSGEPSLELGVSRSTGFPGGLFWDGLGRRRRVAVV